MQSSLSASSSCLHCEKKPQLEAPHLTKNQQGERTTLYIASDEQVEVIEQHPLPRLEGHGVQAGPCLERQGVAPDAEVDHKGASTWHILVRVPGSRQMVCHLAIPPLSRPRGAWLSPAYALYSVSKGMVSVALSCRGHSSWGACPCGSHFQVPKGILSDSSHTSRAVASARTLCGGAQSPLLCAT